MHEASRTVANLIGIRFHMRELITLKVLDMADGLSVLK